MGTRAPQAGRARDAAPGHAAPDRSRVRGFTTLARRLARSCLGGHSTPGRYVVHRLNRTEYANAIRDLLGARHRRDRTGCRATAADFGFDNIADLADDVAAPARAVRHHGAAHQRDGRRRSRRAAGHDGVSDQPRVQPERHTSTVCRSGTRGGTVVRHVFPADGEYKLSGRLVRGVEEGYAGVEGNDTPQHVRDHDRRRGSVFRADRRPEGSRGAGQGHERGEGAHRRAHDRDVSA